MWKRWRRCSMAEWPQGMRLLESHGWPVRLPGTTNVVLTRLVIGRALRELAFQISMTRSTQNLPSTSLNLQRTPQRTLQRTLKPSHIPTYKPHKLHKLHNPANELPPVQCHNPTRQRR